MSPLERKAKSQFDAQTSHQGLALRTPEKQARVEYKYLPVSLTSWGCASDCISSGHITGILFPTASMQPRSSPSIRSRELAASHFMHDS